ncbi:hypothetical protein NEUTE1DRAFT_117761 [Neurospora tetrasperma FGSC 2508]|uniref:Uncharacterized protein n=1 Tax=Neurospora tetrasperma (strain FGSC 2508 / ATCC MYA-4615 / P0657) TaxID=510951 RepID=F8MTS9_NEUT8|nr:uncharacterized protein NEUTE1DRAFT_117761 [Neurospora tetrasperma FGSC 2508]EGO55411.1 hypothetical protein NEUTE1DRAFT_117761 [Neurospora tetrasperma FGSC 2508]EGZ69362.1 hypothetical protein NEUTE2DRAFT_145529 [Neurospora tetrasperma FGSC 2509]
MASLTRCPHSTHLLLESSPFSPLSFGSGPRAVWCLVSGAWTRWNCNLYAQR